MTNSVRSCINCGSDKTYVAKHPLWYKYKDGYLCLKCRNKLITNPKRVTYRRKSIIPSDGHPRTGICSKCGAIKGINCRRTSLHHIQYHDNDPLKDTIEICMSCHMKESRRLGQLDNKGKYYNRHVGKWLENKP